MHDFPGMSDLDVSQFRRLRHRPSPISMGVVNNNGNTPTTAGGGGGGGVVGGSGFRRFSSGPLILPPPSPLSQVRRGCRKNQVDCEEVLSKQD